MNRTGKWAGTDVNGDIHTCRADCLSRTSLGMQRVAGGIKQPRSVVTASASLREFNKFIV